MEREYKILKIQAEKELSDNDKQLLLDLNSEFSEDEIIVKYEDRAVIVMLKALDLVKFKKTMSKLIEKYNIQEDSRIEDEIVKRIEGIGSYGIQGRKRNFVDYNKERKIKNRQEKEKIRGPYYYARNSSFSKKNNRLPENFINKIICGDSLLILKELPDNCIDLIFTSPPYNFGLDYISSPDGYDWPLYFKTLFRIFDECIRILKFGGRIIVDIQPLYSDYIPTHHIISNYFMERKLIWKGEVCWEKNNYNCKYTAWGSWKSPSSPYLKYTWEFLEIFCKGTLKKEGKKENIDITAEEFKKWIVAKWSIAPERRMDEFGHPAMFPEELAERVIKLFSYQGDVVLDPFNGVGTTTVVARRLGRKYIGIDISEVYCKKAIKRIEETLF